MREIKFRVWDSEDGRMYCCDDYEGDGLEKVSQLFEDFFGLGAMQFTGLHDKNGREIYEGDVCEFDNGDKFIVRTEWWLECFGEWIGEPECEDQLRSFYRAEKATILGNVHQNPELLEG